MKTETKAAPKTTEFVLTLVVIAAILIAAAVVNGGDDSADEFIARQAWLYVAIVAGAYSIGRGLAKSGSHDPYTEDHDHDHKSRAKPAVVHLAPLSRLAAAPSRA